MPMNDTDAQAYHQTAWNHYNRTIAAREDDYDEIISTISCENYFAKDAVVITMSTKQWDMAQRLCMLGWSALQKARQE